MQVPALLGLVELRPDRHGRAIPPEAPKHIGSAGLLSAPARRDQMPKTLPVEGVLHLEPVPSVGGNCLVTGLASRDEGSAANANCGHSDVRAGRRLLRGTYADQSAPASGERGPRGFPSATLALPRTPMTIARRRRCGTPKSAASRTRPLTVKPRRAAELLNDRYSCDASSWGTFSITKIVAPLSFRARRYCLHRFRVAKLAPARLSVENASHGTPTRTSHGGNSCTFSMR